MAAIVRIDLGAYTDELLDRAIVIDGHEVGRTSSQVTELPVEPGWSIIVLGQGLSQTSPARFQAYHDDVIEVRVHKNEGARVPMGGGVAGGRYSLDIAHSRPAPDAQPTA